MTNTETAPIACTLLPDAFKDRARWIRDLTSQSLRSQRRDGLSLHLTYEPAAAERVRELVRREQACCTFLRFDLRESADGVHLTVTAPPKACEDADVLFAHLVP